MPQPSNLIAGSLVIILQDSQECGTMNEAQEPGRRPLTASKALSPSGTWVCNILCISLPLKNISGCKTLRNERNEQRSVCSQLGLIPARRVRQPARVQILPSSIGSDLQTSFVHHPIVAAHQALDAREYVLRANVQQHQGIRPSCVSTCGILIRGSYAFLSKTRKFKLTRKSTL